MKKFWKTLAVAALAGSLNAGADHMQHQQPLKSLGSSAAIGALIGVSALFVKRPQDTPDAPKTND